MKTIAVTRCNLKGQYYPDSSPEYYACNFDAVAGDIVLIPSIYRGNESEFAVAKVREVIDGFPKAKC